MHSGTENLLYAPPCICPIHIKSIQRKLTSLMLECWQREYDHRPYNTILLHRKHFECAMHRTMNNKDFEILQQFLHQHNHHIDNFELIYMPMPTQEYEENLMTILCQYMMINVSLCHLNLSSNALSVLAKNATICNITTLRLSGNPFTREHADNLRLFLLHTNVLQYLDIGYCSIDHDNFAIIADGMLNCVSIKAIDISHIVPMNFFHIIDCKKISIIIAILLSRNRLQECHLKHFQFDGHDIVPLTEYLNYRCNLKYLDLGSNNIGAHGIEVLFNALKNTQLIGLDISNNKIGDNGGRIIAHCLSETRIRYLDIGRNCITVNAMTLILHAIKKTFPIRILNVVGNEFDDVDVGTILNRQMNAKVLLLHSIDVTTTFDDDMNGFRIVPRYNDKCEYNLRYNRVMPFYRKFDVTETFRLWSLTIESRQKNERKLMVNCMFIDPIFVDKFGKVFQIDRNGNVVMDKEII